VTQKVAETSVKDGVPPDHLVEASPNKQTVQEQEQNYSDLHVQTSLKDGAEENNLNIESYGKEEAEQQIQDPARQTGKNKQNMILLYMSSAQVQ